ncbi:hypothetical protein D3C73_1596960 [compost metagenome]
MERQQSLAYFVRPGMLAEVSGQCRVFSGIGAQCAQRVRTSKNAEAGYQCPGCPGRGSIPG